MVSSPSNRKSELVKTLINLAKTPIFKGSLEAVALEFKSTPGEDYFMVTKVGLQGDFVSAFKDLLELDNDAIEAYEVAIERIETDSYKHALLEFKKDHERHVKEITRILIDHGEEAPRGPSAKQWLTKGKVILADLLGDESILAAMRSNELDTNDAYERLNQYEDRWEDSVEFLKSGLNDERRHKAWLEKTLGMRSE
jgi:rubrerythrin